MEVEKLMPFVNQVVKLMLSGSEPIIGMFDTDKFNEDDPSGPWFLLTRFSRNNNNGPVEWLQPSIRFQANEVSWIEFNNSRSLFPYLVDGEGVAWAKTFKAVHDHLRMIFPGFTITLEPRLDTSRQFTIDGPMSCYTVRLSDELVELVTRDGGYYTEEQVAALFEQRDTHARLEAKGTVLIGAMADS